MNELKLSEAEKRERDRVRKLVLKRHESLAEIRAAGRALEEWLKAHPDDYQLLREGEGLAMLEEAFLIMGKR